MVICVVAFTGHYDLTHWWYRYTYKTLYTTNGKWNGLFLQEFCYLFNCLMICIIYINFSVLLFQLKQIKQRSKVERSVYSVFWIVTFVLCCIFIWIFLMVICIAILFSCTFHSSFLLCPWHNYIILILMYQNYKKHFS